MKNDGDSDAIDEALDRAWSLLEDGDIEDARRAGHDLVGRTGGAESAPPLLLLAACAREEGKAAEVLAFLARACDADPDWAVPHLWRAEVLAEDPEKIDEALADAKRAIELAEEEDELIEAVTLAAELQIDTGNLALARKTLAELPAERAKHIDPEWAIELAHLFLAAGDAAEARRRFAALTERDPAWADAWHGLGGAAAALHDHDGRRIAWLKALALDQREPLAEAHLSEAEMIETAEEALGELPEQARALIANVPIVVADLPARADVEQGLDPRLLGMFEGAPHGDNPLVGGVPHLTRILLFRKNLERMADDPDHLRDEIRITLLHETGHFFGMSEDELARVGLD
jgi:predicted Zn-dependent protease with MMP-like domain